MAIETAIARGEFFIGAAHSLVFDITDSAGVAQDMSGWDLEFVLRKRSVNGDGAWAFTKTTGAGITVSDGAGTKDRATVAILSTDTVGMFPDTYQFGLWRSDDPSDQPLAYGSAILTAVARE